MASQGTIKVGTSMCCLEPRVLILVSPYGWWEDSPLALGYLPNSKSILRP